MTLLSLGNRVAILVSVLLVGRRLLAAGLLLSHLSQGNARAAASIEQLLTRGSRDASNLTNAET